MAKLPWDQLDADELERVRNRSLRRQVRYQLYPYSDHYRRTFEDSGLDVEGFAGLRDLSRIPLLTREELSADPSSFELRATESLIQRWGRGRQLTQVFIDKLLRGDSHAQKQLEHEYGAVHVLRTSGAVGEPVPIAVTRWDLSTIATMGMRTLQVAGVQPGASVLNALVNYDFAFWSLFLGGVAHGVRQEAPGHIEPKETARLVEAFRPEILVAEAEDALVIFEAVGHRPSVLILGPSQSDQDLRSKVRDAAGDATVVATYGFAEARAVYAECVQGAGRSDCGFHTYPDLEIFEVVGHGGGNLLGQRRAGRIVHSPLDQRGTALIRYMPGDVALGGVTSARCPYCGRSTDRILGPVARSENLIEIQTPGTPVRMVDVAAIRSAMHIQGLAQWELEVKKSDGDPRGPDEVFVFFKPRARKDPAELAAQIDSVLKDEVGIEVSQLALAERSLSGVVDAR